MRKRKVNIICLQETIKIKLLWKNMRDIGGSYLYEWIVKPAVGHSGGMLVAIRKDFFEVENSELGEFFISAVV